AVKVRQGKHNVTVRAGQDGSDGVYRAASPVDENPAPAFDGAAPATEGDASTTALKATEVNAWFGSNHVLKNVNMAAKARSVMAIIGPSGCVKSTLIRCLNRLHEEIRGAKITGKVLFQGADVYAPTVDPVDVRRRIGMVFQRPTPFPTMNIMDNAIAGLKLGSRLPKTTKHE